MVYKAANVSIENLTACNFLGGARDAGNEIWWNGGANSGKIGGHGFYGSYLTTTSTYLANQAPSGEASAAAVRRLLQQLERRYLGPDLRLQLQRLGLLHRGLPADLQPDRSTTAGREYSALGYSGTNSGGRLLVENSQFDNNEDGFDTNSQNVRRAGAAERRLPGRGQAAGHGRALLLGLHPQLRPRQQQPQRPGRRRGGSGSGRHRHVDLRRPQRHDHGQPVRQQQRLGNHHRAVPRQRRRRATAAPTSGVLGPHRCLWDDYGDALSATRSRTTGPTGIRPTATSPRSTSQSDPATNCYSGNHEAGGAAVQPASAAAMQTSHPTCNGEPAAAGSSDPDFLGEVLCDSQIEVVPGTPASCPTGPYPRVNAHRHAPAAQEPEDDAQPVRGRAVQPVVHAHEGLRRPSHTRRAGSFAG